MLISPLNPIEIPDCLENVKNGQFGNGIGIRDYSVLWLLNCIFEKGLNGKKESKFKSQGPGILSGWMLDIIKHVQMRKY